MTNYDFNDLPDDAQDRVREATQIFKGAEDRIQRLMPPLVPIFRDMMMAMVKMLIRHEHAEMRLDRLESEPVHTQSSAGKGVRNPYEEALVGEPEHATDRDDEEQPPAPPQTESEPQEQPSDSDDPAID